MLAAEGREPVAENLKKAGVTIKDGQAQALVLAGGTRLRAVRGIGELWRHGSHSIAAIRAFRAPA